MPMICCSEPKQSKIRANRNLHCNSDLVDYKLEAWLPGQGSFPPYTVAGLVLLQRPEPAPLAG